MYSNLRLSSFLYVMQEAVKGTGGVEEEEESTVIVDHRSSSTSFLYSFLFTLFCFVRCTKIKRHIIAVHFPTINRIFQRIECICYRKFVYLVSLSFVCLYVSPHMQFSCK